MDKVCLNYIQNLEPFTECSLDQLCLRNVQELTGTTKKSSGENATQVRKVVPCGEGGNSFLGKTHTGFWDSPNIQFTDYG